MARGLADDRATMGPAKARMLQEVFNPRANSLNAVRLLLALGVILWHSYPLTGRDVAQDPLRQFLEAGFVDGFFAISGFLITRSWIRRPDLRAYARARALRILPAFWVCLVITALVFAPLSLYIQGQRVGEFLTSAAPYRYIGENFFVRIFDFSIGDTPRGTYDYGWNGSLWTLFYECLCYIGVAALGLTQLLARRWTLAAAAAITWLLFLASNLGFLPEVRLVSDGLRFALVFLAGALIYRYAHRLPANWFAVGAAVVVVVGSLWLSDYRLLAAPFLAYAVITTGALVRTPRLALRNDLSYGTYIYAFPIQQLMVIAGLKELSISLFALLAAACTLVLAAASWFLVERPALRWKVAPKRRAGSVAF